MCRIKLRAEGYARPKGRYRDNLDPAGEAFVLLEVLDTGSELGMRHQSGCGRGEPFVRHHAYSSRNWVVGSTGRNIPATPSPSVRRLLWL